jgi:hypothetical protein
MLTQLSNKIWIILWLGSVFSDTTVICAQDLSAAKTAKSYATLREEFTSPDHAVWGEVPLWWWEGDRLTKNRLVWQLETLASEGVKSICPIQRSPGRCDPQSFSPDWWNMFSFVHGECQRLGMSLWAYDQVGYGHYGWLEKAAAQAGDKSTKRIHFLSVDSNDSPTVAMELPDGQLLAARAFPQFGDTHSDEDSIDLRGFVEDGKLTWRPSGGSWKVTAIVAVDDIVFQLSEKAGDSFVDMFYGEIERQVGREAMGKSLAGVFQDEHPPTPRDVYTDELARRFKQRCGYDITRAIPALHFDIGPLTPKYRTDFFDTYLLLDEHCYWKRVYDWIAARDLLTSHDNWGRQNIERQSQGYIDYFRTQRWFSAPGYDDAGTGAVTERNYYDTKIAASIARLYDRPRVWSEAFHSSGWGRTTDQTLSWLSANYAFGANQYDEHGLYYSARASTWEHAAPDPHWRQPYWQYYDTLSSWVARASYLMSQGHSVVDVAVHYPVVSLLAGTCPGTESPNYNDYMRISRSLYDHALDNDIIDDDSILNATVDDGYLIVGDNRYQALVFGPEMTIRRSVLQKTITLAQSGGTVAFVRNLPSATTEGGRQDPELASLLSSLFGRSPQELATDEAFRRLLPGGGMIAFFPAQSEEIYRTINAQLERDFTTTSQNIFATHRRVGNTDIYLVQNTADSPIEIQALCRVDGVPEIWDAFTGEIRPIDHFERRENQTFIRLRLDGNVAQFVVFRQGDQRTGTNHRGLLQPAGLTIPLSDTWDFSVIPTRDNRWGEFRWPPTEEMIGPEIRSFRYREETSRPGQELGWQNPNFDDSQWSDQRYSIGPHWLCLSGLSRETDIPASVSDAEPNITSGSKAAWAGIQASWQPVEFSKTIGLAKPAPWGGHSGYPDGAIDQNFIKLPEGRNLLFTRIRSPKQQRLGLRVELRNSSARLWVNGVEQPFEDAVGNLPLNQGANSVLIDLPDGGYGMLYVQRDPPAAESMEDKEQANSIPDLRSAFWIRGADPAEAFIRRTFTLDAVPDEARIVVTAYTGYRLYINGQKVHEEIGPWAQWTNPESLRVGRYLRKGKNVIAAWVQAYHGQNVQGKPEMKGLACVMKAQLVGGQQFTLVSDASWKASDAEVANWTENEFDEATWNHTVVLGRMGEPPWGTSPLENVGVATEPYRALSVDLESPYLTCFDEVPEIAYDVKADDAHRVGWFRFNAPPGLSRLNLHTTQPARVWVNGQEARVSAGNVEVAQPPTGMSTVVVRLAMRPGAYGGAAFAKPLSLELSGGKIRLGLWAQAGLPTYSGIGVYRQTFQATEEQAKRNSILDLGQVLVAAEVLLNGRSVGVRLARPFRFDLTDHLRQGNNELEIRVANTVAPHYTVTNEVQNLGPTDSGLLGPVTLRQELPRTAWITWARSEVDRLTRQLNTSTPETTAAQHVWEKQPSWTILKPIRNESEEETLSPAQNDGIRQFSEVNEYLTELDNITGLRFECLSRGREATGSHPRMDQLLPRHFSAIAHRATAKPFVGQFVRIEIPTRQEFLHMAEVEVFSGSENVARKGRASQSSTGMDAAADRAIDGNTNGSWSSNSVTHTGNDSNPWWEVDLGHPQKIDRIVIYNRIDGNLHQRLHDFQVSILDQHHEVIWSKTIQEPPNPKRAIDMSQTEISFAQEELVWHADRNSASPGSGVQRFVAVARANKPFGYSAGTRLEIRMDGGNASVGSLSDMQLSVTTATPPLFHAPQEIEHIRRVAPSDRTRSEAERLAAFFRSIAPNREPVRQRLRTLTRQLHIEAESP